MWNQTPWQIAHRSFHLNNRLLGWGFARDGWGTSLRLYSEGVPGLIWSMLQQSESPVACSAPSRAVRYASGLWQPGGRREEGLGENEITAIVWSGKWDHWLRMWSRPGEWFYRIRAHASLVQTPCSNSLSETPDRLPKLFFASRGWMLRNIWWCHYCLLHRKRKGDTTLRTKRGKLFCFFKYLADWVQYP